MQTKYLCVLIHIWIKGEVGAVKPVQALQWGVLLTVPRRCFFCGSFMILFCLVFAVSLCASVYMCLVVTYWERADLLALVCGVYCEFVTFPLVSWVRCGTWLYRFLIFAPLLTLIHRILWIIILLIKSWQAYWVDVIKFYLNQRKSVGNLNFSWTRRQQMNDLSLSYYF